MFHQWTQRAVAASTCSRVRQGLAALESSALYSPLTVSARALSYESPAPG